MLKRRREVSNPFVSILLSGSSPHGDNTLWNRHHWPADIWWWKMSRKLLGVTMFDISKIRLKSILHPVKTYKVSAVFDGILNKNHYIQSMYYNINPLSAKLFGRNINIYLHLVVIVDIGNGPGCWDPLSRKTRSFPFHIINIMAADGLVTPGARASAAMILT